MSDTSTMDRTFVTPTMAAEAVAQLTEPEGALKLLRKLMDTHGRSATTFDIPAARALIKTALDERFGVYYFVGPRGGISPRGYQGLPAAQAAAGRYSPRAQLLLVCEGGKSKDFRMRALKFAQLFPGRKELIERLIALMFQDLPSRPAEPECFARQAIEYARQIKRDKDEPGIWPAPEWPYWTV